MIKCTRCYDKKTILSTLQNIVENLAPMGENKTCTNIICIRKI